MFETFAAVEIAVNITNDGTNIELYMKSSKEVLQEIRGKNCFI